MEFAGRRVAHYRVWPVAEAVVVSAGLFVAVFTVSYFIFVHAQNAQKGEIQEGLLRTARAAALLIDGDTHRQFRSVDQEDSPQYRRAIGVLQRLLDDNPDLKYVYTMVLRDGRPYFVLDPTPAGDRDGDCVDDKAHIMQRYFDATEAMMTALNEQRAVVEQELSSDPWGTFISAYAPFFDSSGRFAGIVGIDLTAENYFARLAPMKRATVRAMVTGFFAAFLIGTWIWFIRRFFLVVNDSRLTIFNDWKRCAQGRPESAPGTAHAQDAGLSR
jgi:hypothetical protein